MVRGAGSTGRRRHPSYRSRPRAPHPDAPHVAVRVGGLLWRDFAGQAPRRRRLRRGAARGRAPRRRGNAVQRGMARPTRSAVARGAAPVPTGSKSFPSPPSAPETDGWTTSSGPASSRIGPSISPGAGTWQIEPVPRTSERWCDRRRCGEVAHARLRDLATRASRDGETPHDRRHVPVPARGWPVAVLPKDRTGRHERFEVQRSGDPTIVVNALLPNLTGRRGPIPQDPHDRHRDNHRRCAQGQGRLGERHNVAGAVGAPADLFP